MAATKIDWTDKVWNPVTGCTKVSQGCKHCYAEVIANRFWGNQFVGSDTEKVRVRKFTDVQCHEDRLKEPFQWKKPCKIFVNSMGDLFHEDVSHGFLMKIFHTMLSCKRHTFMILTKRPERMVEFIGWIRAYLALQDVAYPYESQNIWLGVSVEDQKTADERIPLLLQIPAAVRFVSIEPMLDAVRMRKEWLCRTKIEELKSIERDGRILSAKELLEPIQGIDWVICGGESGKNARPMHPDWVRTLRSQCIAAGVPFFFKQWGEWLPYDQVIHTFGNHQVCNLYTIEQEGISDKTGKSAYTKVGKKKAGHLIDGKECREFPAEVK